MKCPMCKKPQTSATFSQGAALGTVFGIVMGMALITLIALALEYLY